MFRQRTSGTNALPMATPFASRAMVATTFRQSLRVASGASGLLRFRVMANGLAPLSRPSLALPAGSVVPPFLFPSSLFPGITSCHQPLFPPSYLLMAANLFPFFDLHDNLVDIGTDCPFVEGDSTIWSVSGSTRKICGWGGSSLGLSGASPHLSWCRARDPGVLSCLPHVTQTYTGIPDSSRLVLVNQIPGNRGNALIERSGWGQAVQKGVGADTPRPQSIPKRVEGRVT